MTVNRFTKHPSLSLSNTLTVSEGAGYIGTSGAITLSGTSELPVLYVKNPSTSKTCFASFYRLLMNTTATHTTLFKFYWNPAISSNGTPVIINNLRNNSATNPSQMLIYSQPTVSTAGVLVSEFIAGNLGYVSDLPLIVDPGYSLLINAVTQASSDVVIAELSWFEINL